MQKLLAAYSRLIARNASAKAPPFRSCLRAGFSSSNSGDASHSQISELVPQHGHRRLRRSLFYVPGSDLRKIEKVASLGVDCAVFDLEDGVAPNRKQDARNLLTSALSQVEFKHTEVLIRINHVGSGLEEEDFAAVLSAAPDGFVVPKVETEEQVRWILSKFELLQSKRPDKRLTMLWGIESALGLLNLRDNLRLDQGGERRLDGLIFGAEDYANSVGARRSRSGKEVEFARMSFLTHCAAYQLQAIDMVATNYTDPDAVLCESKEAFHLGFDGKQAIHPNQISPIHQGFSPTFEETAAAMQIVNGFFRHSQKGEGAFSIDGKMIDMPVVLNAAKLLLKNRHIESLAARVK